MLIVIPERTTGFCGLADHAEVISVALEPHGIRARIIKLSQAHHDRSREPVLIQFTPLAYSAVGLPLGLLLQLVVWRLQGRRVLLFFHELPFSQRPSLKQSLAVISQWWMCGLLSLSSSATVVNQRSRGWGWRLISLLRQPLFLPSFSNIGEAKDAPLPEQRSLQVVIFGSPGKRRHAHRTVEQLGGYQRVFGMGVKVLDIGEPLSEAERPPGEVNCLGPLSRTEVLALLLQSRFGLFYAEPQQFSKSGVFAAYCATGVLPVIAVADAEPGELFLAPREMVAGGPEPGRSKQLWNRCRYWARTFSAASSASALFRRLHG